MVTLSAPAKSGYKEEFESFSEAREKAAQLLGLDDHESVIEVESPDGGTVYCYASQDEADADKDGAYAIQYSGEPE